MRVSASARRSTSRPTARPLQERKVPGHVLLQASGVKSVAIDPFYQTDFPTIENPLSEGGRWVRQDQYQTDMRVVSTAGGNIACGTQSAGPNAPYDDSMAYLLGFPRNQGCMGRLWKSSSYPGTEPPNHECELWLRHSDALGTGFDPGGGFGLTTSRGYEINFQGNGAYLNVARFKE